MIKPIAYAKTDFKEKFGIPRQSGRVSSVAKIVFYPEYSTPTAFTRIEEFSHLWLIFDFSENHREKFSPTVRPPRLGGNERVGVFASRSPFRPNNLGLSCVRLLSVNRTENPVSLTVEGADLLDGTPVFDVKPYVPSSDRKDDATGGYSSEFTDYRLNVEISDRVKKIIPQDKLSVLFECVADDPRPSYHQDGRIYKMRFSDYNVVFSVCGGVAHITSATVV